MTLTIDISPALEGRLRKEAERRRMAAGELARIFLEERLLSQPENPLWERPADWKVAFHEWVASHEPGPVLSDEAISHESMYEDREVVTSGSDNEEQK